MEEKYTVFEKYEWRVLYYKLVEEKENDEIGKVMDMSKERVRQIYEKTRRKIANVAVKNELL
jgi:DNA-directed RNA polymerase sigma subunit (sigma70/sigma32)